jgi:hypothetical protein
MSNKDYERGRRDGKENTYHPPVRERLFTSYKKDELERLDDYKQGYGHGKQDRERKRK